VALNDKALVFAPFNDLFYAVKNRFLLRCRSIVYGLSFLGYATNVADVYAMIIETPHPVGDAVKIKKAVDGSVCFYQQMIARIFPA
jgi:hypothetical protein